MYSQAIVTKQSKQMKERKIFLMSFFLTYLELWLLFVWSLMSQVRSFSPIWMLVAGQNSCYCLHSSLLTRQRGVTLSLWKADCMFCLYFFHPTRRARVLVAERSYLSLRGRKRVPQFLQQKFHNFSLPILLGQNVQHIISILLFSNTYLQ